MSFRVVTNVAWLLVRLATQRYVLYISVNSIILIKYGWIFPEQNLSFEVRTRQLERYEEGEEQGN